MLSLNTLLASLVFASATIIGCQANIKTPGTVNLNTGSTAKAATSTATPQTTASTDTNTATSAAATGCSSNCTTTTINSDGSNNTVDTAIGSSVGSAAGSSSGMLSSSLNAPTSWTSPITGLTWTLGNYILEEQTAAAIKTLPTLCPTGTVSPTLAQYGADLDLGLLEWQATVLAAIEGEPMSVVKADLSNVLGDHFFIVGVGAPLAATKYDTVQFATGISDEWEQGQGVALQEHGDYALCVVSH